MCQERTQLGRDDSDCDVDVPTTRVWPWWVELCQLPVTLSPLRGNPPLPPLTHFPLHFPLSFSRQSCHIWFFGQCSSWQPCATITIIPYFVFFLFFVLLPTTSNNWKYAAYYFPFFICISLLFQFISKFSVGKTNESFPPPNRQRVLFLFASFVFCMCVCEFGTVVLVCVSAEVPNERDAPCLQLTSLLRPVYMFATWHLST